MEQLNVNKQHKSLLLKRGRPTVFLLPLPSKDTLKIISKTITQQL